MKVSEDRRNFFRLAVDIPVHISFPGADEITASDRQGVMRDLSGGGMRLETAARLPETKRFQLGFTLPINDLDKPAQDFYVSAQVVRKNEENRKKSSTYGVRFVDILPGIQDRIVKYLFDLQIASRYHVTN